ncbi:hypothetical protein [Aeromonas phage SW69-9]|uniref:Uncharacterized protein n=2 Tax=Biquartavirus 44RR2 TaxID=115987 RepID=Q6U980_9CAUD|nr:hypothetical protein ST44RRORF222w [Aeromonas phage 44RR2.8t]AAQ81540.1 hypothetical protein 44RRORF222w [Aeromonas phage 44RR2.8t]APU02522.1 hypothetical protein [Aeromonas phage SW69-9]
MSQRHGRFWSIGFNAVGYTGSLPAPNWGTQIRRFAGLNPVGNGLDPALSEFYFGQGAQPAGRWMSQYFNRGRTPSRCFMWSGSRYPYNSWSGFDWGGELTQIANATIKIGWIGTGRASHRGGDMGYINLRWKWDNDLWQETRIFTTPDTYVSDWYGNRVMNLNRPGGGRGTLTFKIVGNVGDFDQHDVGDRGPNASWSPVVDMSVAGSGYQGELFKSFQGHQTRQYNENN